MNASGLSPEQVKLQARARELAETKMAKRESGDIGTSWNDWIIAHALLREAEALIGNTLK